MRFYWSLAGGGAIELANLLAPRLARAGIPFTLKFANEKIARLRCDSAILYVAREFVFPLRSTFVSVYEALSAHIRRSDWPPGLLRLDGLRGRPVGGEFRVSRARQIAMRFRLRQADGRLRQQRESSRVGAMTWSLSFNPEARRVASEVREPSGLGGPRVIAGEPRAQWREHRSAGFGERLHCVSFGPSVQG